MLNRKCKPKYRIITIEVRDETITPAVEVDKNEMVVTELDRHDAIIMETESGVKPTLERCHPMEIDDMVMVGQNPNVEKSQPLPLPLPLPLPISTTITDTVF